MFLLDFNERVLNNYCLTFQKTINNLNVLHFMIQDPLSGRNDQE